MFNPEDALLEWWALVKPGGYLLLTVPDEDLYEQGFFPSRFNFDHKLTFRFRKPHSWCQKSYDVESLVSFLPGVQIVSAELQSDNYYHSLQFKYGDRASDSRPLPYLYLKLERRLGYYNQIVNRFRRQLFQRCVPIDQTHGDVLAQIQLVAQSRLPVSPRFENE